MKALQRDKCKPEQDDAISNETYIPSWLSAGVLGFACPEMFEIVRDIFILADDINSKM
jgi:hypothetical protein